jgi:hypothetical protein
MWKKDIHRFVALSSSTIGLRRRFPDNTIKVIKALGKPFVIPMCGMETTIMPAKYLSLLKQEDREELSLCQGFEDVGWGFPIWWLRAVF